MRTGAGRPGKKRKGGASQSRDVIPNSMLLKLPRTGRLDLKGDRDNRRGPVFFQLQSDIWHIKYLVKPDHLQRRQMTQCGKETHFILLT
jgi:hypothetical protein